MRYHLISVRMAIIKMTKNNKGWQGYGERKPLCTFGGICKLAQPLWEIVWRFRKRIKNRPDILSSNNTMPGYLSKENKNTN